MLSQFLAVPELRVLVHIQHLPQSNGIPHLVPFMAKIVGYNVRYLKTLLIPKSLVHHIMQNLYVVFDTAWGECQVSYYDFNIPVMAAEL